MDHHPKDPTTNWHGAAPDHFMTHLAVSEGDPTWGEHVGDADYRAGNE